MKEPTSAFNPGALQLLELREKQGTQFSLVFSLGMMLLFVGVAFSSAQSRFELLLTLGMLGVSAAVLAVLLFFVTRQRMVGFAGWCLVVLYLVVILSLPWIWYQSVGGNPVPKTYFLKINILPLMFICLVLCSLPGRPWFPLVFTVVSTLSLLGIYAYALADPSTVLASNILDSVLGPGASLDLAGNNVVLYVASGLLLSVFLQRFRSTVIQASEAEHSSSQLGRYFSPGLVSLIARSDSAFLKPGGQLQPVTVLFSDIRGFTSLSEGMAPGRVVELLSLYQEQMVAAIFDHGGTLDKFIGDGIMATFGTPEPAGDDALRAVRAGLSMQKRLVSLNVVLKDRGFPELRQGIGIHCGPVIAGNVGTSARLEYTVIGDVVNTASRIESLCKETGDSLLFSESVARLVEKDLGLVDGLGLVPRGQMPVKGKAEALTVFTVG